MKKISIHQLSVYGYHGCLPEEAIIGTNYTINIDVDFDFSEAAATDNLALTVDYVAIARIAKEQMAIRANLIENVCKRIHMEIKRQYPKCNTISVELIKLNPPAEAELQGVSVCIKE